MKRFTAGCIILLLTLALPLGLRPTAASGSAQDDVPPFFHVLPKPVCISLKGEWKNQSGSILDIMGVEPSDGMGSIFGNLRTPDTTFVNAIPVQGCVNIADHKDPKDSDQVVVVSFLVRWGKSGDVTTWNGYYRSVNGKPTIVARWLLCRSNASPGTEHITTGEDQFVPVK